MCRRACTWGGVIVNDRGMYAVRREKERVSMSQHENDIDNATVVQELEQGEGEKFSQDKALMQWLSALTAPLVLMEKKSLEAPCTKSTMSVAFRTNGMNDKGTLMLQSAYDMRSQVLRDLRRLARIRGEAAALVVVFEHRYSRQT